jgi:hypothetical protein
LPKPKQSRKGEIIDPYVQVDLLEPKLTDQEKIESSYQHQMTPVVENNGFNPQWEHLMKMKVQYPEHSMLYITIYDKDKGTSDDFIAYNCFSFSNIQSGYRHIPLLNEEGDLIPLCYLYVYINIHPE